MMKCPKCGTEIDDPSIHFCPNCGAKIEWPKQSDEAHDPLLEEDSSKSQTKPESSAKTDKPPVSAARGKNGFFQDVGKAFQYAGSVLIHPVKTETPKRISVSLILDLFFFVCNFVVLFLTLHGLFQLKINQFVSKILTFHYQRDNIILNTGRMLEMTLLFTFAVLAGMIVLTLLSQLLNKERISFFNAVKQSTRQLILPVLILLIVGILMMFKPGWAFIMAVADLLIWTMNLNDLFKNQWRFISRSIVIISTVGLIILVNKVILSFFL